MRKNPDYTTFAIGDLVYLDAEYGSDLKTLSKSFKKRWIGPLRIQTILDDSHYLISDWEGKIAPIVVHPNRLKKCYLNMGKVENKNLITVSSVRELFKHIEKYGLK